MANTQYQTGYIVNTNGLSGNSNSNSLKSSTVGMDIGPTISKIEGGVKQTIKELVGLNSTTVDNFRNLLSIDQGVKNTVIGINTLNIAVNTIATGVDTLNISNDQILVSLNQFKASFDSGIKKTLDLIRQIGSLDADFDDPGGDDSNSGAGNQSDGTFASITKNPYLVATQKVISTINATVQETIASTAELQMNADRAGTSMQVMSELKHVVESTGVSLEVLGTSLEKQGSVIKDAVKGNADAAKAISDLGLSASELLALKPDQQFELIAEAMKGISSSSERARIAGELWGKENVVLLNSVQNGSEGVRQLRFEAVALGQTLNSESASSIAGMAHSFNHLKSVTSGLFVQAVAEIAPALTEITNIVTNTIIEMISSVKALLSSGVGLEYIKLEFREFLELFDGFEEYIAPAFEFLKKTIVNSIPLIKQIANTVINSLILPLNDLPLNISTLVKVAIAEYMNLKASIDGHSKIIWERLKFGYENIGSIVNGVWLAVKESFFSTIDEKIKFFGQKIKKFGEAAKGIDFLSDISKSAINAGDSLIEAANTSASVTKEIDALTKKKEQEKATHEAAIVQLKEKIELQKSVAQTARDDALQKRKDVKQEKQQAREQLRLQYQLYKKKPRLAEYIAELKKLEEKHKANLITDKELVVEQKKLIDSYKQMTQSAKGAAEANKKLTDSVKTRAATSAKTDTSAKPTASQILGTSAENNKPTQPITAVKSVIQCAESSAANRLSRQVIDCSKRISTAKAIKQQSPKCAQSIPSKMQSCEPSSATDDSVSKIMAEGQQYVKTLSAIEAAHSSGQAAAEFYFGTIAENGIGTIEGISASTQDMAHAIGVDLSGAYATSQQASHNFNMTAYGNGQQASEQMLNQTKLLTNNIGNLLPQAFNAGEEAQNSFAFSLDKKGRSAFKQATEGADELVATVEGKVPDAFKTAQKGIESAFGSFFKNIIENDEEALDKLKDNLSGSLKNAALDWAKSLITDAPALIKNTFEGLFKDIVNNGSAAFKNFGERLKQNFKQIFSDLGKNLLDSLFNGKGFDLKGIFGNFADLFGEDGFDLGGIFGKVGKNITSWFGGEGFDFGGILNHIGEIFGGSGEGFFGGVSDLLGQTFDSAGSLINTSQSIYASMSQGAGLSQSLMLAEQTADFGLEGAQLLSESFATTASETAAATNSLSSFSSITAKASQSMTSLLQSIASTGPSIILAGGAFLASKVIKNIFSGIFGGRPKPPKIVINTTNQAGVMGDYGEHDFAYSVLDSKLGNVQYASQHDMFAFDTEKQARAYHQALEDRLNKLDDTVIDYLGEDIGDVIATAMKNVDVSQTKTQLPDFESFFLQRFEKISEIAKDASEQGKRFYEGYAFAFDKAVKDNSRFIEVGSQVEGESGFRETWKSQSSGQNLTPEIADDVVLGAVLFAQANDKLKESYQDLGTNIQDTVLIMDYFNSASKDSQQLFTDWTAAFNTQIIPVDPYPYGNDEDYFDPTYSQIEYQKTLAKAKDTLGDAGGAFDEFAGSIQAWIDSIYIPYSTSDTITEVGDDGGQLVIHKHLESMESVIVKFIQIDRLLDSANIKLQEFSKAGIQVYATFEKWAGGFEAAIQKVTQLQSVNQLFQHIGGAGYKLSIAGVKAADKLITAADALDDKASGMESLNTLVSQFFDAFSTAQDKLEMAKSSVAQLANNFENLYGIKLPDNTEEFQAFVKSLASGETPENEAAVKLDNNSLAEATLTALKATQAFVQLDSAENSVIQATDSARQSLDGILDSLNGISEAQKAQRTLEQLKEKYGSSADTILHNTASLSDFVASLDATDPTIQALLPDIQAAVGAFATLESALESNQDALTGMLDTLRGTSEAENAQRTLTLLKGQYGSSAEGILANVQSLERYIASLNAADPAVQALIPDLNAAVNAFKVLGDAAQAFSNNLVGIAQGFGNQDMVREILTARWEPKITEANEFLAQFNLELSGSAENINRQVEQIWDLAYKHKDEGYLSEAEFQSVMDFVSQWQRDWGVYQGNNSQSQTASSPIDSNAADAAAKALADLNTELQQSIDTFNAVMESLKQARKGIYDSKLSIHRDIKGWDEVGYQNTLIGNLNTALDEAKGADKIEVINQLNSAVMARYNAELEALETTKHAQQDLFNEAVSGYEALKDSMQSLREFTQSLDLKEYSPLKNQARYLKAQQDFQQLLAIAPGDAEAIAKLPAAFDAYMAADIAFNKSSGIHTANYNDGKAQLEALGASALPKEPELSEYESKMVSVNGEMVNYQQKLSTIQATALNELEALDRQLITLGGNLSADFKTQTTDLKNAISEAGGQMSTALSTALYTALTNAQVTTSGSGGGGGSSKLPSVSLTGTSYKGVSESGKSRSGTLVFTPNGLSSISLETGIGPLIPIIDGKPAYAKGTNLISNDGWLYAHKDEAIVPKHLNPAYKPQTQNNQEVVAEIRELRRDMHQTAQRADATEQEVKRLLARISRESSQQTEHLDGLNYTSRLQVEKERI